MIRPRSISRRASLQSLVAVAALALVAAGAVLAVGPNVSPPVSDGVVNSVHSFATDHPEWRVLQSGRKDKTPLVMGHAKHMNADTPGMQERLRAWVKSLLARGLTADQIPVRNGGGGVIDAASVDTTKLSLSCAACHELDASGRYMQAIRFEQHCAQCHGLGEQSGEAIPHGRIVVDFIDRKAAMAVAKPAVKAPPAATTAPAPAPARGPRGPRGGPAAAPPADESLPFKNPTEMAAWLSDQLTDKRDDLYNQIVKNKCAYCHRGIVGLRDDAPGRDWTKLDWAKVAPHIPDRWLPRSVFDHRAHAALDVLVVVDGDQKHTTLKSTAACLRCHEQAGADFKRNDDDMTGRPLDVPAWSGATSDIMIPGVASCRQCHAPAMGVRSDCVACHIFHGSGESRPALSATPPPSR